MKTIKLIAAACFALVLTGCGEIDQREVKDAFIMKTFLHKNGFADEHRGYTVMPSSVAVQKTETENVWLITWTLRNDKKPDPVWDLQPKPQYVNCRGQYHVRRKGNRDQLSITPL